MTETTETTVIPEPIEGLFRDRGFRVLYWTTGEARRVDETDPETMIVVPLTVLFANPKRLFVSMAEIEESVLYALVGQDELADPTAMDLAVDYLLQVSDETGGVYVAEAEGNDDWAKSSDQEPFSDAEIIRAAADNMPGTAGDLLYAVAGVVESLPEGLSYADPRVNLAVVATKIAWDAL